MIWKVIAKTLPFIVIATLLGFVLWQRNLITEVGAENKAVKTRVEAVVKANKTLAATVNDFAAQRVENEAIFDRLSGELKNSETKLIETRTIIEREKASDPVVNDWANQPVPNGVRRALRRAD